MTNAVEFKHVTKTFDAFTIQDLTFDIKKGYITGFIGSNGAGKSTTIKLLMNLIKKEQGTIQVFGLDQDQHESAIKQRIGFVYDENCYYETLTINELRRVIAPFYRDWDDRTFDVQIERFGLPRNQQVKTFSKGMKMKMSIAFALSHHPDLIIMDEPTSGLDPIVRREVLDLLYEIMQDEEKTIFFSTHITTDLDRIADYIVYIQNGKILFSKEREALLLEYGIVKGDQTLLNQEAEQLLIGIRRSNVGFEGLTKEIRKVKAMFGDAVVIEQPTLEDIMFYTTKGEVDA